MSYDVLSLCYVKLIWRKWKRCVFLFVRYGKQEERERKLKNATAEVGIVSSCSYKRFSAESLSFLKLDSCWRIELITRACNFPPHIFNCCRSRALTIRSSSPPLYLCLSLCSTNFRVEKFLYVKTFVIIYIIFGFARKYFIVMKCGPKNWNEIPTKPITIISSMNLFIVSFLYFSNFCFNFNFPN